MKSVCIRLDPSTHAVLEAATELTGLTKTGFITMATTIVLNTMTRVSLPAAWIPPQPAEEPAPDPLMRGVLESDSPEVVALIRDANAINVGAELDREVIMVNAARKQELIRQVLAIREKTQ